MADFMADLNGIYGNKQVANQNIKIEKKGDNTKLRCRWWRRWLR